MGAVATGPTVEKVICVGAIHYINHFCQVLAARVFVLMFLRLCRIRHKLNWLVITF